jgi:NAD(P)-dependent dehydrogenase (short-subunit alcohol dehydrogenase family)
VGAWRALVGWHFDRGRLRNPIFYANESRRSDSEALVLLSDEASFVTGAALPVDGGVTAA